VPAASVSDVPARPRGWYRENLLFCRLNFKDLVGIVIPPAVLSYLVFWGTSVITRHIGTRFRHELQQDPYSMHIWDLVALGLSRCGGLYLGWLLSCSALAAISVFVRQRAAGQRPSARECYLTLARRPGAFTRVVTLLFITFGGSLAITFLVGGPLLFYVAPDISYGFFIGGCCAIMVLWILWFSPFVFAIPITAAEPMGALVAWRRSKTLSEPYQTRMFVLLVESEMAGYIAAVLPRWLVYWVAPSSLTYWQHTALVAVSVVGVAVAQLPMMAGISAAFLHATRETPKQLAASQNN